LQFALLEFCIVQAVDKKDKAYAFDQLKLTGTHKPPKADLRDVPGLNPAPELLQVWSNVDLVARLLQLGQGSLFK
jgi:hypothetical protein